MGGSLGLAAADVAGVAVASSEPPAQAACTAAISAKDRDRLSGSIAIVVVPASCLRLCWEEILNYTSVRQNRHEYYIGRAYPYPIDD